jgi:Ca-activated chloride channel family protein
MPALLLALCINGSSVGAYGRTPAPQEPQSAPVIRKDVDLVLVEATIRDGSGRPMKDLKQDDFQLYEEGTQQKIVHFSQDQLPLAVALVVDQSGSIKPFLRPLQYATLTALRTLKPDDQVALFVFSDETELLEDLTYDKRRVSGHFESLDAGGSTNINDALFLAAEYLRKEAPKSRRVIILVSDNVPTDPGIASPNDVMTETLEADAAIYSIKIPGENPSLLQRGSRRIIGHGSVNVPKVAEETGGEVFDVEKEGSLFLAFQSVIERLKTRYTLGFYPDHAPDGRFRRLEVKLDPHWGTRGKDYVVLAKRGYYSPRPKSASR